MSVLIFPYISFLRYLGANTIWYWHRHLECDKLCMSVMRQNLLLLLSAVGEPASILAKGAFLVSEDFYSHRQSRWFIYAKALIKALRQKNAELEHELELLRG